MASRVSDSDLRRELNDLQDRYPKLKPDELFVFWFLLAFVTDDEKRAVESLCGGAGDKSVDAVLIDDDARMVFVLQGKYRKQLNAAGEARNDVLQFATLGPLLAAPQSEFAAHVKKLAPSVHQRLTTARNRVRRGYGVQLCYVTGGRCSSWIIDDAKRAARTDNANVALIVIDGTRVLRLLADYLDGVAPPVPSLDLEIDGDILRHYDRDTDIES